jgi:hypothetical protein
VNGSKLGLVVLLAFPLGFRPGAPPLCESPQAKTPGEAEAPAPDLFASTVRPVLLAKCAPCHEPGGKMYGSMPFDRGETIASHREGVLKRLKGDDRAAVEKWLASLPPAPAK